VPNVRLTQVFRQSAQSLIVRNAHQILKGQKLELDQSFASNFIFVVKDKADAMAQAVVKLYTDILPNQYGFDPQRDIQVLTPSHKGRPGRRAEPDLVKVLMVMTWLSSPMVFALAWVTRSCR